jgi:hypothetical protein
MTPARMRAARVLAGVAGVAAGIVGLLALPAAPAAAHATLVGSDPKDGATVKSRPPRAVGVRRRDQHARVRRGHRLRRQCGSDRFLTWTVVRQRYRGDVGIRSAPQFVVQGPSVISCLVSAVLARDRFSTSNEQDGCDNG